MSKIIMVKTRKKIKIKEECDACGGTGLYSGMCEGEGEAVICICCNGRGWTIFDMKIFTHRKKKKGITKIRRSMGRTILSCGGTGEFMTYKEFEEKYPVEPVTKKGKRKK